MSFNTRNDLLFPFSLGQGIKTFIYTILGTVTIQRRVPLSLVIDIIIEQGTDAGIP